MAKSKKQPGAKKQPGKKKQPGAKKQPGKKSGKEIIQATGNERQAWEDDISIEGAPDESYNDD